MSEVNYILSADENYFINIVVGYPLIGYNSEINSVMLWRAYIFYLLFSIKVGNVAILASLARGLFANTCANAIVFLKLAVNAR